jgi:hypothetical protein
MKKAQVTFLVSLAILSAYPQTSAAQWVRAGGPGGRNVAALAVVWSSLLAGTTQGVFLSTNNGQTWFATNSGLPDGASVLCLEARGTNLFAGTDNGVFLSANNGATWKNVSPLWPWRLRVECLGSRGADLFAGTDHGVILSTDNGSSWVGASLGLSDAHVTCFGLIGTSFFAGAEEGLFLLRDDHKSWQALNRVLPAPSSIACLRAVEAALFASVMRPLTMISHDESRPAVGLGIFRSTDGGKTWSSASSGIPENAIVDCLAVSGTNILAGTDGKGVFLSTNQGQSWTPLNTGLPADAHVRCFAISEANLFAGILGRGIWRFPLSALGPKSQ